MEKKLSHADTEMFILHVYTYLFINFRLKYVEQ